MISTFLEQMFFARDSLVVRRHNWMFLWVHQKWDVTKFYYAIPWEFMFWVSRQTVSVPKFDTRNNFHSKSRKKGDYSGRFGILLLIFSRGLPLAFFAACVLPEQNERKSRVVRDLLSRLPCNDAFFFCRTAQGLSNLGPHNQEIEWSTISFYFRYGTENVSTHPVVRTIEPRVTVSKICWEPWRNLKEAKKY